MGRLSTARLCLAVALTLGLTAADAHHAFSVNFDVDSIIEVRGRIAAVQWQNPHVLMTLVTADGKPVAVESQAKNILERTELGADLFPVGSSIALAGFPAREGNGIFALNAQLADGRELILRAGRPAYFGGRQAGNPDTLLVGAATADENAKAAGLFRVWSMQFAGDSRWRWPARYPLTPAAMAAQERFDAESEFPVGDCTPKGMPRIMSQPFPIEFVREGSSIVLKLEEGDAVRTIHLQDVAPEDVRSSPYGYSVGRFDGDALVVQTTAIDATYLPGNADVPLTSAVTTDERFAVSPDGSRLNYTLTIKDPATFTEPVVVENYWIWRPGITLETYGCTRTSR